MKIDRFERRVNALEARLPPVKSNTMAFLEKCTVEELRQLRRIVECGGEPTLEDSTFLEDLEAKYGHVREVE